MGQIKMMMMMMKAASAKSVQTKDLKQALLSALLHAVQLADVT